MNKPLTGVTRRKLRSSDWFNNPHNPGMTALYLERYLNYGLTRQELQSGKPIIGIAQTGSDLSPCNRHHLELAHRVREGIRAACGGRDRLRRVQENRGLIGAVGWPLQHDGNGLYDELAGRGSGHVTTRMRRDPGPLSRARSDCL